MEIDRKKLEAKVNSIPEGEREAYLQELKTKGYTWKSNNPQATASKFAPPNELGLESEIPGLVIAQEVGKAYGGGLQKVGDAIADKSGQIAAALSNAGHPQMGSALKAGGIAAAAVPAIPGKMIAAAAEMVPTTPIDLAAQEAGGKALGAVVGVGADVAPSLISTLTRIEKPVVERYIARGKEIANTDISPQFIENSLEQLKGAMKAGRAALGRRLAAVEDAVAEKLSGRVIPTNDIGQELTQKLGRSFDVPGVKGGDVRRPISGKTQEIIDDFKNMSNKVPAEPSGLVAPNGQPIVSQAVDAAPRPMALKDAIKLKRKIYDAVSYDNQGTLKLDKQEASMLKDAADTLNQKIREASPRLKVATDAFSSAAKAYDDLADNVLGGKIETVQKRIGNLLNKGSAERKILAKTDRISKGSSEVLDKVLDAITGSKFEPWVNPSVERAAVHTGGGVLGAAGAGGALGAAAMTGHPVPAALAGGALAATSPALSRLGIDAFTRALPGTPNLPQGALSQAAAMQALALLRKKRSEESR